MSTKPSFYKNRISINVLAGSIENAKECYEAVEGHTVLGVLSKNYDSDQAAIDDMKLYQAAINNALSIGLGAGDPNQSAMVSRLARVLKPQHVNQVFTGSGVSRGALGEKDGFVNALISPTGKVGYVNIATGPISSKNGEVIVTIEQAINLLKDMGVDSVKYYPMKGLAHKEEYRAVAKACAKMGFGLEPTGGIDLNNFEEIMQIAVDEGVPKIIPHIYSSIIDSKTGLTKPEDVVSLYEIVKKVLQES